MLQTSGLWLALATFLSIWWGHVGVRWLEAKSADIRPPMVALIIAGLILNLAALFAPNVTIGGVCSVVGIALWWDAFELVRQDRRVRHGHAPANPNNPAMPVIWPRARRHSTIRSIASRAIRWLMCSQRRTANPKSPRSPAWINSTC